VQSPSTGSLVARAGLYIGRLPIRLSQVSSDLRGGYLAHGALHPDAEDEEAEEVYQATKPFVETELKRTVTDRRSYSVSYRHDGEDYDAKVGGTARNRDTVVAILESTDVCFVWTPNRAVIRGQPILMGKTRYVPPPISSRYVVLHATAIPIFASILALVKPESDVLISSTGVVNWPQVESAHRTTVTGTGERRNTV